MSRRRSLRLQAPAKKAASCPGLPLEVVTEIINKFADDVETLKACSLISQPLRTICQQHLFYQVSVNWGFSGRWESQLQRRRYYGLLETMTRNPQLGRYVRILHLGARTISWTVDPFVIEQAERVTEFLASFTNLETIQLVGYNEPSPPGPAGAGLDKAIMNLLSQDYLRAASIKHFVDFPLAYLQALSPNLKLLKIESLTEAHDLYPPSCAPMPQQSGEDAALRQRPQLDKLSIELCSTLALTKLYEFFWPKTESPSGMDLSCLRHVRIMSESHFQDNLDASAAFLDKFSKTIATLSWFNGHGCLFPEGCSIVNFPYLHTMDMYLGFFGAPIPSPPLDPFLTFLESGPPTAVVPLKNLDLTVIVSNRSFEEVGEEHQWERLDRCLASSRFQHLVKVGVIVSYKAIAAESSGSEILADERLKAWKESLLKALGRIYGKSLLHIMLA